LTITGKIVLELYSNAYCGEGNFGFGKFGKFAAKLILAEKNWQIFPSSD